MLKRLATFAAVRTISSLLLLYIMPIHDNRPFGAGFRDLNTYMNGDGFIDSVWGSPNPLYAALVRTLGYSRGNIQDAGLIALSLALNIAFTAIFVVISSRVHRPRQSLMYAVALGTHPYLALYALKLDTSVFALLPVGLLTAGAMLPPLAKGSLLLGAVLSLLRNALLPMLWLQAIWNRKPWRRWIDILGLAILTVSSTLQLSYGARYVGQNYGCYSLENIRLWLTNQGWQEVGASIGAIVLTPFVHLLMDLGAREAIADHCLALPTHIAKHAWVHFGSTAFFLLLHGILLWRLIIYVIKNAYTRKEVIQLLFPLSMLLPTLYGSAHMRYLIPLIPVLLLMAFQIKPKETDEMSNKGMMI